MDVHGTRELQERFRREPRTDVRALLLAALLAFAVSSRVGTARADGSVSVAEALRVDGPACVDRVALEADLAASLGGASIDARLRIAVHNEEGHRVVFSLTRDGVVVGERRLAGQNMSCAQLAAVVGLAIATALDATVADATSRLGPPSPETATPEVSPPEPGPPPRERDRLSVAAEPLLVVGVLPVAAFGGALRAGVRLSSWLEARLSLLATARESFGVGNAGTEAYLLGAAGGPCFLWGAGLLLARGCVGAALGAISVQGLGLSPDFGTARFWAAASAGLGAKLRLTPAWGIVMDVDGFVPWVAPRFEVDGPGGATIATRATPPAGLAVGGGVVLTAL